MLVGIIPWIRVAGENTLEAPATDRRADPDLRRPVEAVLLEDGNTAVVANGRAGSLSLVDVRGGKVLREVRVATELSGLARIPRSSTLVATDSGSHRLLVVRASEDAVHVVARHETSLHPRRIAVSSDGNTSAVSCQWSHRLDLFDLRPLREGDSGRLEPRRSVELPFPPLEIAWLPGNSHVLAADSLGGRMALVEASTAKITAVRELTGHGVRGLAFDPNGENLYVSHQILNESSPINWQTVHSGKLMNNVASRIPVAALLRGEGSLDAVREIVALGTTGHGGGDPSGLLVLPDGGLAVCLSGTSEAVVLNRYGVITQRMAVGLRPTRLMPLPDGSALVVDTFGDSLTHVDWGTGMLRGAVSLGPQRPLKPSERGELLFYDARLSHDGWLSCHSCHTDGHSNGLLSDTQGDGSDGAPKRVLGLGHVAFTDKWAWNGRMQELYDQVRKSLLTSMLSDDVNDPQVNDLVAYLQTLLPPPPRLPPEDVPADRASVAHGRNVFLSHGCQSCHVPPLTYTASDVYDVGLKDEHGATKFNPPSLRGVGHGRRHFHDNRAGSLEDVFRQHGHPSDTALPEDEITDLVRFLRSL